MSNPQTYPFLESATSNNLIAHFLGLSYYKWKLEISIWYELLDKFFPKKSNFVMSQLDQYFAAFPLFHHTHYKQVCKKYLNISSSNFLPIPHYCISLQRASLSSIWKIVKKIIIYRYDICLHDFFFLCSSFLMHSHNPIQM